MQKTAPKDYTTKRRIVCITEFRDDFNPCDSNNANNSITLHTLSIILLDSAIDSKEFTYLVAIDHKSKDNVIIETHCIKTLSKMINPSDNKLFYCALLKDFINIIIYPSGFVVYKPGKRFYLNHAGSDSECSSRFSVSCNVKDMHQQLASCEECEKLLAIREDCN